MAVRADQVEYFEGLQKVVAAGNVEAIYKDAKLTCDFATIYTQTKDAYLQGRVRLVQLDGLLKGEEIIYNFETRKGIVIEAEGESGPWRSKGDRAQKISADTFLYHQGSITSCDFEEPHTRLKAREVRVFLDDKVVLKNVVMYVGKMPVFYVPSYTHPLDDKRPRVTIIPGRSKEWGLFLLTAWRVYAHENLQGRFHVDYRERFDLATGVDLKYRLPIGGDGIFREYYTNQRSLQRKHFYSKYSSPDKDRPTTEVERFRFQLRHLWQMDESTRLTLEYYRAKDATLIKDFFEREFEENTANPASYLQIIRSTSLYGLTFLVNKRINRFETITQQLPFISLSLRPIEVPWLPRFEHWLNGRRGDLGGGPTGSKFGWYYQSTSKYEHSNVAEVKDGTKESLVSFDTLHELFYPLRLWRRLNFRPFVSFQHSAFSRGAKERAPQFRQAAATGFDLSSKLFRVFPFETNLWGLDIHRLRHVMTPTLEYKYQAKPTLSEDRFLRGGGIAKGNTLKAGLEHKFQTKRQEKDGSLRSVDVGRFLSAFPYDIEGSSGRGGEWQNLSLDAELTPYSWLVLESDATIDPHIGKVTTINADFVASATRGNRRTDARIGEIYNPETGDLEELPWAVGLGWRYQRNTSAQITLEAEFNLGKKWRVGIYQAFDVKRFVTETSTLGSRTVKKIYDFPEFEYRLRRDLHEWTVELVYNVKRQQGDLLLLLFRLKAAPELPLEFERNYHRPKAGRNFSKTR